MSTVEQGLQDDNSTQKYGATFTRAITFVLPEEDEYLRGHWGDIDFIRTENVPGDNGSLTKWGVDQASHPGVDIVSLTFDQAVDIYHQEWMKHNLDTLPEKLAIAAFDVWVNGGQANLWLQKAYNHCNPSKTQLVQDGVLGTNSLTFLSVADPEPILQYFIQERNTRFQMLAATYSNDRQFLAGWEQRDTDLAKFLAS